MSDDIIAKHIVANFYPTPPEAVRALLSVEQFEEAAGYSVFSTDLDDLGYGYPGFDFLRQSRPRAKHIVTNPPYGRGLADASARTLSTAEARLTRGDEDYRRRRR